MIVIALIIGYLAVGMVFARLAYQHEYGKIYGAPAPQYYGGRVGHERAHEVSMREARPWIAMWFLFCTWAALERMISGPKPVAARLDEMQAEVDRLAEEQNPIKDLPLTKACPCGYVTECHIHCGDGSCHTENPWLWEQDGVRVTYPVIGDKGPEIIRTAHPEKIVQLSPHPGIVWTGARWITDPGDWKCSCSKCSFTDHWIDS